MSYKRLTALKALLIVLVTSVTITGINFLDDKIWNIIVAVIGVIAYGIVGLLYSIHLIDGKQEGKTAYVAVFIILIIIGFLIYQGILKVEQWILSWPIAVKIIVPTVMGLLIVGTITLLVIVNKKKHIKEKQYILKCMKKLLTLFLAIMLISLTSCGKNSNSPIQSTTEEPSTTITTPSDDNPTTITEEEDETANMTLTLKIGNTSVDVFWLDNESVKNLKKHVKEGLTIELHQYGNFEQTGLLGFTLVSNDTQMSVGPGDIVLYNSNQICLYYDNNSWSFTKLGHINLSKSELRELLAEEDTVIITLGLK